MFAWFSAQCTLTSKFLLSCTFLKSPIECPQKHPVEHQEQKTYSFPLSLFFLTFLQNTFWVQCFFITFNKHKTTGKPREKTSYLRKAIGNYNCNIKRDLKITVINDENMFMKMGMSDVVNSTQVCISNIFKNILCDEGNIMRIRLVSSQLTFMPLYKIYTYI